MILASHEDRYEAQRQAIVVINTLNELDENWIGNQTEIINALKNIWQADLHKVGVRRKFQILELKQKEKNLAKSPFIPELRCKYCMRFMAFGSENLLALFHTQHRRH